MSVLTWTEHTKFGFRAFFPRSSGWMDFAVTAPSKKEARILADSIADKHQAEKVIDIGQPEPVFVFLEHEKKPKPSNGGKAQ